MGALARPFLLVSCAMALAGCLPDLSAFVVGNPTSEDASAPPPPGAPCPTPMLLIATESFADIEGLVMRFHLDATGAQRCSDLDAGGGISGQPYAVTGTSDLVVVASSRGVTAIDPHTDFIRWTKSWDLTTPNDAFQWYDSDLGQELFAVAANNMSGCGPTTRCPIRELIMFDAEGITQREWSSGGEPLATGYSPGIAPSPFGSSHVLVFDSYDYAAVDVDLFGGPLFDPSSPYVEAPDGAELRTIAMGTDGETVRLAWAGSLNDVEGLFFLRDDTLISGQHPTFGPGCGCELVHVIPDPLNPTSFLGLCVVDGVRRNLVRFDEAGSCETILTGDAIGTQRRMSYLALVE